jgi:NAD(P)-dependent dehydrogenase (short-subunit alcohol dehydrogenase family)
MKDRVCLVSGAGPGTGRATALAMAREGAHLVLAGRTQAVLAELAGEVEAAGARVLPVVADVTLPEDRERLVAAAIRAFGGIDVLVNNAFATGRPGAIDRVPISKAWKAPFEVNLFATLELTQAVVANMRGRGGGAVVMVGTLASVKPVAGLAAYAASKAALLAAARSLALELGPLQIRVNTVVPGHIDGPALEIYFAREAERLGVAVDEVRRRIAAESPLGRIASSEDVADAIVFLASRRAQAITGQALHVNGGQFFA